MIHRVLAATVALAAAATVVSAQERVYEATMSARQGLNTINAQLTLTVHDVTTEEDANRIIGVLQNEGSDAFLAALRERDLGVAHVKGGPSAKILHARVHPGENGRRVVILTDGPIYFPQDERQQIAQDVVGVIQLVLNDEGRGRGSVAEATKVRVTDSGVFEVEAARNAPIDISNVRQVK